MAYEVRTAVYEGPFDLLLHLILRQEVDLWEVSLAPIVDEYLTELERLESLDLDVATEFLLIAATSVELKTRRLLPAPSDLDLDEDLLRFEERDLLLARLLECKTFKDAAGASRALIATRGAEVARAAGPEEPFRSLVPDPLERVRPEQLLAAAAPGAGPEARAGRRHRSRRADPGERRRRDRRRARSSRRSASSSRFRLIAGDATERLDVIVRFLAVLELYKQGVVDIEQLDELRRPAGPASSRAGRADAASIADGTSRRATDDDALDDVDDRRPDGRPPPVGVEHP